MFYCKEGEILGVSNLISLLGGVALFLFGMTLMGEGLKKVAGNRLEVILYQLSSTPLRGMLLGTGVTAIIQSSSATSVMVVGFVNSGMMKVRQAIGIVMGAILGTSVTGWILCLSSLSGGSGWVTLLDSNAVPAPQTGEAIIMTLPSWKAPTTNPARLRILADGGLQITRGSANAFWINLSYPIN